MKTGFVIICLLSALWPTSSPGGMAVSDAVTHTLASKLIGVEAESKANIIKQLQEAYKANEWLTKSYEAITGTYNRAQGFVDQVNEVRGFLGDTKSTILGRYSEIEDLYDDYSDGDVEIEDVLDVLDVSFKDPRTTPPDEWHKLLDRQYEIRQKTIRQTIKRGQDILQSMPERMQKIVELANQIDNTANTKDSSDLTNRILIEMLTVLNEQLALSMEYHQMMATLNYQGVTEESMKTRKAARELITKKQDVVQKEINFVKNLGVDDLTDIEAVLDATYTGK
ncbi:type IV secretion system protein [Pseudodesulfovibrio senegalensis]|nr:type IV secretion system protein [Pseudodesulfovibrio senegalensis]